MAWGHVNAHNVCSVVLITALVVAVCDPCLHWLYQRDLTAWFSEEHTKGKFGQCDHSRLSPLEYILGACTRPVPDMCNPDGLLVPFQIPHSVLYYDITGLKA